MKWKIEWDNDVGEGDEYYVEWWNVTDENKSFRANSREDAEWLCDCLNKIDDLSLKEHP